MLRRRNIWCVRRDKGFPALVPAAPVEGSHKKSFQQECIDGAFEAYNSGAIDTVAEKLRSMGAVNTDPPLPHSKFIKVLKTGRVMPWNELLAEQPHSEVACCDATGDTDPSAWKEEEIPGGVVKPIPIRKLPINLLYELNQQYMRKEITQGEYRERVTALRGACAGDWFYDVDAGVRRSSHAE